MGDKHGIMRAGGLGSCRRIALLGAIAFATAYGMFASPASPQSIGDRFKSLFGVTPQQPVEGGGPPEGETDLTCPPVSIRAGASTYAVAAPGKQPVGNDLRVQATITRTARDCTKNGDQITARIGIQGRVIAGPAGAPSSLEIPLRVAVVQGGVQEKTIATKVYRTTVAMSEDGNVPFALVAEDLVYPVPLGAAGDSYIFYIGFDPQALKPEPKSKAAKKKEGGALAPK
jgi:hypothetical protein